MKQTRNTIAKSKIISMLQASEVALSHAEIESAIDIEVNRVTIYRILERLIEAGTIHKVVNTDGAMKFAICHHCSVTHQHNHVHFSCVDCKEVTCLEDVIPSFKLSRQYEVIDANFMLSGRCPACVAKIG